VIEYYINELLTEGIYHIPTWTELSECCASASVEGATASLSVCAAAAANNTSSSVTPGSSALLRTASSSSTMQLGASAGNIAIDTEGYYYYCYYYYYSEVQASVPAASNIWMSD